MFTSLDGLLLEGNIFVNEYGPDEPVFRHGYVISTNVFGMEIAATPPEGDALEACILYDPQAFLDNPLLSLEDLRREHETFADILDMELQYCIAAVVEILEDSAELGNVVPEEDRDLVYQSRIAARKFQAALQLWPRGKSVKSAAKASLNGAEGDMVDQYIFRTVAERARIAFGALVGNHDLDEELVRDIYNSLDRTVDLAKQVEFRYGKAHQTTKANYLAFYPEDEEELSLAPMIAYPLLEIEGTIIGEDGEELTREEIEEAISRVLE